MADGGDVIYTLRGDDSELEKDLSNAEKKVEQSAKSTGDKSAEIEKETGETQKKVKEDVTEHHKQQNQEQEKSDEESAEKREKTASNHGEKLKSLAGGTAKAIGAGMLAAGTAVVGIGVSAVNSANNLDQAMNQYLASTGKSTEETERYKKVMEDIYTNNYGDSFEDIGQAMSDVTKNLGELNDADLQKVTESAFALRDTFGYEITESTRAAKAMIQNFGISGDEAMGLIAAGAQNGLDYSGELIDSINEYSTQFAKVGLDADDMFKIFQKGAETGAWNIDKIGDAVKEMSIRVIDGSDTTKEGFETIGLNADEMSAKFAKGGDSAKEAFQQTIDALAKIEDPLKQNTAGVDLFGTMWEDLGPEVVTQLADIEDGAYDASDAMGEIKKVKYNDLSSMFEGLKRTVEVLLIPLGEQLIPLLKDIIDDILPAIKDFLPHLVEMISGFVEQMMPTIEEILPKLMDSLSELLPVFMDIIEAILPTLLDTISKLAPLFADLIESILPILTTLMNELLPPITKIIEKALPPLIKLIDALMPILQTVIDLLMPIIDLFLDLLDPIIDVIDDALVPLVEAIQPLIDILADTLIPIIEGIGGIFKNVFGNALSTVKEVIGNITNIFKGIVDFIKCVFKGDWEGAWNAIVDIFDNIISGIANIFKIPINWIIDELNWFIDGINSIQIPDWVPLVGGMGFNIPKIPRLKVGMDYVPSDFFPAYLDEGEAVLTKQENAMYRQLGGLQGMFSMANNIDTPQPVEIPEIDYKRIGTETAKALEGFGVYMDSKTVGKVVAKPVNDELGKITKRRT